MVIQAIKKWVRHHRCSNCGTWFPIDQKYHQLYRVTAGKYAMVKGTLSRTGESKLELRCHECPRDTVTCPTTKHIFFHAYEE